MPCFGPSIVPQCHGTAELLWFVAVVTIVVYDFALLISVEEKLCGATVSSTDQTTQWSVGRSPSCRV